MHLQYSNTNKWIFFLGEVILYIVCTGLFIFMLVSILQYTDFKTDIGFLKFKQQYVHSDFWMACFYTHVFTSFITLLLGLIQFSNVWISKYPKLHRWLGRIYVFDILLINFPTGLVLALTASGYLKISFVTLDCLWFWFTYKGLVLARNGNFKVHKQYMMRSYALTFSAITLRLGNVIFNGYLHFDPAIVYATFSIMGWLPNLLFVEFIIIRRMRKRSIKKTAMNISSA